MFFLIYPFLFFLPAFTFEPQSLLFLLPGQPAVIRCLWCRMSVALALSESWCEKEKPSHCLAIRGVSVYGILAPKKKFLVFLTQKKSEDFTRRVTHPHISFVSNFLSTQKCAYVESQNRSHINYVGPPWSQKSLHVHLHYSNCAFKFHIPAPNILSLGCIFYLKWKNWCNSTWSLFSHLCISTAVTLKDTLQMSAEFLHCLQQQAL